MDYFAAYKDVWEFHKKYIDDVSDVDEFWEEVIADADKLCRKYGSIRFVRDLILAEITEFERLLKEVTFIGSL